jgi:hypothetical protein
VQENVKVNAADMIYSKPGKYLSTPYVVFNGTLLKNNTDYTVSYLVGDKDITNEKKFALEGDFAEVAIELKGKGNYAGSLTFSAVYKIKQAPANAIDLSKAKITMKGNMKKAIPAQEFTGTEITPDFDIFVKVGREWKSVEAAGLTKDTDFAVDIMDNVQKGKATIFVRSISTSDKAIKSKTATFKIVSLSFKKLIEMLGR